MASYVFGALTGLYFGASVREHYDFPSLARFQEAIDKVFRKVPRSSVPPTPSPPATPPASSAP